MSIIIFSFLSSVKPEEGRTAEDEMRNGTFSTIAFVVGAITSIVSGEWLRLGRAGWHGQLWEASFAAARCAVMGGVCAARAALSAHLKQPPQN